jgi:hypothetical protein
MATQEDSPLKARILADDYGLGKTITVLSHIFYTAERAARPSVNPNPPPFTPTLILCPAILLPTRLGEIGAHYGRLQKKAVTVDTLDELQVRLIDLAPDDSATVRPSRSCSWRPLICWWTNGHRPSSSRWVGPGSRC